MHGLSWRFGLPVLLLVLAETVGLALYLTGEVAADKRARLERLAQDQAVFLVGQSMRATEKLAEDLRRVTGVQVWFRSGDQLQPAVEEAELAAALREVRADGVCHVVAGLDCVALAIPDKGTLLLADEAGGELWTRRVLIVLVSFWGLAIVIAWLAVRGLVRPLRSLAQTLPTIDDPSPPEVPEAQRNDEIGDVARAFVRARTALHDEREQRARMEKLAVLGRMTASLAHEIQNPVAAIKLHAQLWGGDAASDSPARVIEDEAGRIEELLNQWMFLTRPEPPALRRSDLGGLLAEVVRQHAARARHARVELRLDVDGDLELACDKRRLGHVFGNLIVNAIQAMPSGGEVVVRARAAVDAVEVVVADCGQGFSEAALRHFAEFFFSEREGGMGIGLGVAHEIVRAHGGRLAAHNVAGGGAEVRVTLPRRAVEVRAAAEVAR